MNITILKGYHLTATDRKYIRLYMQGNYLGKEIRINRLNILINQTSTPHEYICILCKSERDDYGKPRTNTSKLTLKITDDSLSSNPIPCTT